MTVVRMVMHAFAHLPGRWIVTGATNTKLFLRYVDAAPLDAATIDIPGMGFRMHADGTARALLHDGNKVGTP